jgi:hypothetical protein
LFLVCSCQTETSTLSEYKGFSVTPLLFNAVCQYCNDLQKM